MVSKPPSGAAAVEAYLESIERPHQDTLRALRATLRGLLPVADEGLKYGMPSFLLHGRGVAAYRAFRSHCSYFPFSGAVIEAVGRAAAGYRSSKGALRFAVDEPLPRGLVRALVSARLAELSDVRNGARRDYYDDGRVKAEGGVKDGRLHGPWRWYRRDGTLMRTGRFAAGEQTGTWETWSRDGRVVKTTRFPR